MEVSARETKSVRQQGAGSSLADANLQEARKASPMAMNEMGVAPHGGLPFSFEAEGADAPSKPCVLKTLWYQDGDILTLAERVTF